MGWSFFFPIKIYICLTRLREREREHLVYNIADNLSSNSELTLHLGTWKCRLDEKCFSSLKRTVCCWQDCPGRDSEGLRETLSGPVREQGIIHLVYCPAVTVRTRSTATSTFLILNIRQYFYLQSSAHLFMMREMDAIELKFKILWAEIFF